MKCTYCQLLRHSVYCIIIDMIENYDMRMVDHTKMAYRRLCKYTCP